VQFPTPSPGPFSFSSRLFSPVGYDPPPCGGVFSQGFGDTRIFRSPLREFGGRQDFSFHAYRLHFASPALTSRMDIFHRWKPPPHLSCGDEGTLFWKWSPPPPPSTSTAGGQFPGRPIRSPGACPSFIYQGSWELILPDGSIWSLSFSSG